MGVVVTRWLAGAAVCGAVLCGCAAPAAEEPLALLPGCDGVAGVRLAYASGSTPASDQSVDIFGVDATDHVVRLTDDSDSFDPAFTPDGRSIVFARIGPAGPDDETSDGIWVMDAGGDGERLLAEVPGAQEPQYSPDGSSIAFLAGSRATPRLHVMAADGTDVRQLTVIVTAPAGRQLARETEPAWSPDGSELAFVREFVADDLSSVQDLMVVEVGNGRERMVARSGGLFEPVQWSQDGLHLLVGDFDPPAAAADRTRVVQTIGVRDGEVTTLVRGGWGATYAGADDSLVYYFTMQDSEQPEEPELHELDTASGETRLIVQLPSVPYADLAVPLCTAQDN